MIGSGGAVPSFLGRSMTPTITKTPRISQFSTRCSATRPNIRNIAYTRFQSRFSQARQHSSTKSHPRTHYSRLFIVLGSVPILFLLSSSQNLEAESPVNSEDVLSRKIRLSEVKEHGPTSERPWVIRGEKVYDITDWIQGHPGGEIILKAAGGSIDPYVSKQNFSSFVLY